MEPTENEENQVINNEQNPSSAEATAGKAKTPVSIAAAIVTAAAMLALAAIVILHPSGSTPATGNTSQQPSTPTSVPADIVTVRPSDAAHIRGDASKAQILIFEYSDSDCPFCEQFHPTLQQVVKDYKGKVAWVYRYFPLDMHPNSHTEALALQCVGQIGGATAFNSYLDTIINVTLSPTPQANEALTTFAAQQGIDKAAFNTCMTDPATAQAITASSAEAEKIGAQGTPFSIAVNVKTGKQAVIPGAYPVDELEKTINSLL